jgi:7-cyano-7-deazaguanine synthase
MRVKSVILLSGGLDSAANLAFCRQLDEPLLALTARYGQRAADRECEAARRLCRFFDVPHEIIDLPWLGKLGGSSLTDPKAQIPSLRRDELDDASATVSSAKSVWVPNRNGVLINVAAAFAERSGAKRVVVGFNREEAETFPDNSRDFMETASRSLALSTANSVEVHSYTADWDKREIVRELLRVIPSFPFELVWSCYFGGATPCGHCESCQRYARAREVRTC